MLECYNQNPEQYRTCQQVSGTLLMLARRSKPVNRTGKLTRRLLRQQRELGLGQYVASALVLFAAHPVPPLIQRAEHARLHRTQTQPPPVDGRRGTGLKVGG